MLVIRRTAHGDAGPALVAHLGAQDLHETRFADARRATEQHHLPKALLGLLPAPPQQPQFLVAPHQEGHPSRRGLVRLDLQQPAHPKHRHRLGDAFEFMSPEVVQGNRLPHQAGGDTAEDHRVGRGQAFQAGGNVHRVPGGQVFMPPATAHFPHHHGAGVEANAHGELHAFLLLQTRIERRGERVDQAQPRMHAAQGIVFVRHRPAKVHQQAIPEILRDVARVLVNHLGGGGLVGAHDLPQVFGVELLGEPGGVRQVAEHHRQLPPFGLGGLPVVLRGVGGEGRGGAARPRRRRLRLGDQGCRGRSGQPAMPGRGRARRARHDFYWGRHGVGLPRPDQHFARFIDRELAQEEFFTDVCQQRLIEAQEMREGTGGPPPVALEYADRREEERMEPCGCLGAGRCRGGGLPRPDQTAAVLDNGRRIEEGLFQVGQGVVVEGELPLERAVGQATATLEHRSRLVEDLLKSHRPPSLGR